MFDRPQTGERTLLVHQTPDGRLDPEEISEFRELALAAGGRVVDLVSATRARPDARLFIGSGKTDQLRERVQQDAIDLVIFNHELSPSQERNLEKALQCRVVDRTGLILDIFAQRAQTFEGKLQVELAQLQHLATRLVRGWTHLERQKGGIGLRGPGETQLETDRRLLQGRISQINRRLEKVDSQRHQGRRARNRADLITVSCVGYTNAGKSTLFNRLTEADVLAKDQLFATLDPTFRRLQPPGGRPLVLADTVGFVSRLPHELVAAFRSTLQESASADWLLHVIDAASTRRAEQMAEVESVLQRIGAADVPRIEIYNKIDLLEEGQAGLERDADGRILRVRVSALTGAGIDDLLAALREISLGDQVRRDLRLEAADGRLRARLFELGAIHSERPNEMGGWSLELSMSRGDFRRLCKIDSRFRELTQDTTGDSGWS